MLVKRERGSKSKYGWVGEKMRPCWKHQTLKREKGSKNLRRKELAEMEIHYSNSYFERRPILKSKAAAVKWVKEWYSQFLHALIFFYQFASYVLGIQYRVKLSCL